MIGRGVRATEDLLCAEVMRLCDEAERDWSLLAQPVRVVVPSRSLREHLAGALVRRRGRALAGVEVQTLHSVALDVLAEAGDPRTRADTLLPIMVRQFSRAEPALRAALEPMRDAWSVVVADVRDLLDAGFDPAAHAEALDECIAEEPLPHAARERARAVVRVAAQVGRRLAGLERVSGGGRLAVAARGLRNAPELLRSRAILVHGFADATGVASDLLEELTKRPGARVFVDRPPDPAAPAELDSGSTYTQRLLTRLSGVSVREEHGADPPPKITLVKASGERGEVRAAAETIRDLLTAGTRPESIGVVARALHPYRAALRTQLGRLGIPFHGIGASAPAAGVERRLHALIDLVGEASGCAADRWLDARTLERSRRMDLRIAWHVLGAAQLGAVAALDPKTVLEGESHLVLPVGRGIVADAGAEDAAEAQPTGGRLRKRRVPVAILEEEVRRASELGDHLDAWPDMGEFSDHSAALRALAVQHLGWQSDERSAQLLETALRALDAEIPAEFAISRDDLVALLRPMVSEVAAQPLGGGGAGVQVLSVTAARARTFEHLFVLGLNRDVFPRSITDAPLLPDGLRRRLEALLPEIPVPSRALDEERYLFAQLVSASPRVVLSWQSVDEEGKARAPSPLIEPLRLTHEPIEARSLASRPEEPARPRPAHEAALLEGLHGDPRGFRRALEAAARERAATVGERVEAEALAEGRARVLAELERGGPERGLGPYLGFVGSTRRSGDPRNRKLFITRVEGQCRCPWQAFVEKILEVEAPPDALESLPTVTPLLKGAVVHDALEAIARDSLGERSDDLDALLDREAVPLAWPDANALEEHLRAAARKAMRDNGISMPGFGNLLVASARRLVEAARRLAWPGEGSDAKALGVEAWGSVEVRDGSGRLHTIGFRADRIDRTPEGVRLVDYKSGRPYSDRKKDDTLRGHLRQKIAEGKLLQAGAYAAAVDGTGTYVYLREPEWPAAVADVRSDDAEFMDAFRARAAQALDAVHLGVFFPRLVDDKGNAPRTCDGCSVVSACVQGDSTARRRLLRWLAEGARRSDAERALVRLWEGAE